jgi:aspartate/methionine/tyrosine aminotransferase
VTDTFFARLLDSTTSSTGYACRGAAGSAAEWDLGMGEVRYPMPARLRGEIGRAVEGIESPAYSDPVGELALRRAFSDFAGLPDPAAAPRYSMLVTAGGKEAAVLAARYLLAQSESGGALVPSPGWEPYRLWIEAAGREVIGYDPVRVAADPSILGVLARRASRPPALLILNYPHNPTGTELSQPGMDEIVRCADRMGMPVLSDEVYRSFGTTVVSAAHAPDADPGRHLVVDSCSKSLAAAGLRVGFLLGHQDVVSAVAAVRATYASCTSIVTQVIATALLTSPTARSWLAEVRADIQANHTAMTEQLCERGIQVAGAGGIYLWCRIPADRSPVRANASRARAVVTDGAGFGAADHFRLCVARAGLDPVAAADAVVATVGGR